MKTFVVKLLVFVVLLFAADLLLGNIVGDFYKKSKNTRLKNLNYVFANEIKDDILFFGASEVKRSIITNKVIEETGLPSYNLSQVGCGVLFQYPLLETILEKHTPKVILISARSITGSKTSYLPILYPYYNTNKYVKEVVDVVDSRAPLKLALQGYAFNSLLVRVFKNENDKNAKGYSQLTPKKGSIHKKKKLEAGENYEITEFTKDYFIKFLETAVASGAKVYVYLPPSLEIINDNYFNTVKSVTEHTGATLMDFGNDQYLLSHPELFNDRVHTNKDGAEYVTSKIIETLKKDIEF